MIDTNKSSYERLGWLKAQAGKTIALGLKVSKASKKFNMF